MDLLLATLSLTNLEKLPTFFLTSLPGLLTAQTLLSLKQEDDKTEAIVLNQQSLLCSPFPNAVSPWIAP